MRIKLRGVVLFVMLCTAILTACGGGGGGGGGTNTTTTYTVTYDGNGNTGGSVPVDTTSYQQGQTVTVLGNTGNLVETNYTFAGWNTKADGSGTTYTQGQTFTMGTANVTLYCKWTANSTYTMTYDGNGSTGGSVPIDTTSYQQGQTITVPGNTGNLVETNYTFAGWNTKADGSGTTYTQGQTFTMGTTNVTLYAQWTANPTYTVTYSGNGSTGGTVPVDSTSYQQGQTVRVLGNTGNLVNTGYTFAGWNTASNGSGTTYAQGATFTIGSANVTLYAVWYYAGSCNSSLNSGTTIYFCAGFIGSSITASTAATDCASSQLGYGTYTSAHCSTSGVYGTCTLNGGTSTEVVIYVYTANINDPTICSLMGGIWH